MLRPRPTTPTRPRARLVMRIGAGIGAGIGALIAALLVAPVAQALTVADLATGPFTGELVASQNASGDLTSASVTDPAIRRAKPRTRPWAYPVREGTPISGTFGEIDTYWPGGHAGIDFDGAEGDPIFAVLGGRVIYAGFNSGGYGNLVIIRRGDGTEVRYAHLSRIGVDRGDRIRAGERIGLMGATGQATGAHLHLEVRVNGGVTPTNPASLWSGKRLGIPAAPPAWSCAKYGGCA